jgi:tRNA(adenine34) deaminase
MCAGAIVNSRIKEVVFGAYDKTMGCIDSVTSITSLPFSNTTVFGGIREDECKAILTEFFKGVREK